MFAVRGDWINKTTATPGTRTSGLGVVQSTGSSGSSASTAATGGGGSAKTSTATTKAAKAPELEDLLKRYTDWLSGIESGGGLEMDMALSRIRDLGEAEKKGLLESAKVRGVSTTPAIARQSAKTQEQVAGAMADIALGRERMMGEAIRGGESLATAPYNLALAEKGLGLQAAGIEAERQQSQEALALQRWMAEQNAQNQQLQNMLALAQFASSPIYSGV